MSLLFYVNHCLYVCKVSNFRINPVKKYSKKKKYINIAKLRFEKLG